MVNQFNQIISNTELREMNNFKIHELITLASIIQAEAGSDSDMSKISSVVNNRLNTGNNRSHFNKPNNSNNRNNIYNKKNFSNNRSNNQLVNNALNNNKTLESMRNRLNEYLGGVDNIVEEIS